MQAFKEEQVQDHEQEQDQQQEQEQEPFKGCMGFYRRVP